MIAIHHREGSFSDRWLEYCKKNHIRYKIVNCYDSNIINQLEDCDGLMWHWPHWDHKAALFAQQLTNSLKKAGKHVFPDHNTSWHYDDKIAQKYLLEAVDAPLVQSYVFYEKEKALEWINHTTFPKVFKTRNGAGSKNVRLIRNKIKAKKLINKCFDKGIPGYDKVNEFKESLWKYKRDRNMKSVGRIGKYFIKLFLPKQFQPEYEMEKKYAYFQDFIPNNDFDIRIIIIGKRAFGIKRFVRENDFRASGSGKLDHSKDSIPVSCINNSFSLSKKLETQSLAIDFIFSEGQPYIVEISYAFPLGLFVEDCPGYWDNNLLWHEEKFHPEYFMIEDFVNNITETDKSNISYKIAN